MQMGFLKIFKDVFLAPSELQSNMVYSSRNIASIPIPDVTLPP